MKSMVNLTNLRATWRVYGLMDKDGKSEDQLTDQDLIKATQQKLEDFGRAMQPFVNSIDQAVSKVIEAFGSFKHTGRTQ